MVSVAEGQRVLVRGYIHEILDDETFSVCFDANGGPDYAIVSKRAIVPCRHSERVIIGSPSSGVQKVRCKLCHEEWNQDAETGRIVPAVLRDGSSK